MADDEDSVFSKLPVFTWKVGSFSIALPVAKTSMRFVNRLPQHKRPYRPGARLDKTGPDPIEWEFSLLAYRDSEERGIAPDFYPVGLEQLIASAELQETGELTTPRGVRRCCLATITTVSERAQGVDAAAVVVTWIEDNEDDDTVAAFEAPTARSALDGMVRLVGDTAAQAGAGGDLFESIRELGAELVGLANYPGDTIAEMAQRVRMIDDTITSVYDVYASAPANVTDDVSALMTDPLAGPALRAIETFVDTAARSIADQAAANSTRTITYARVVSIFDVAIDVDQDAGKLIRLNGSAIADYFEIPPQTPIVVEAA